jgi:hypothetical protein
MRKSATLLLALVFLTASSLIMAKPEVFSADVAEDSWASKAPMQVARSGLGVSVVNGKIYAIGGSAETGVVGTNEEYDPATDTWAFKKSMPTPREVFAIVAYQNKIYCVGGYTSNGTVIGVNEVYDPATDMWENKTPMPTPRWLLQANGVNAKIYLIGGLGGRHVNEVYDPATDAWTQKTPPPISVDDYASVVVDNKIYLIGGHEGYGSYSNQNQIYDPENDTWSSGQQAPQKAVYAAAGVTSGVIAPTRVYVLGVTEPVGIGVNIGVRVPSIINQVFDPESDSWMVGAPPPTNRINMGIAVVDDKLYAIGGSTYEDSGLHVPHMPSAVNEQYTPIGYGTVPVDNNQPAPFPIRLAVAVAFVIAALLLVAAVGVGLSAYLKKRK